MPTHIPPNDIPGVGCTLMSRRGVTSPNQSGGLRESARKFLQLSAEHDIICSIEDHAGGQAAKRKPGARLKKLEAQMMSIRARIEELPSLLPGDLRAKAAVLIADAVVSNNDGLAVSLACNILAIDPNALGRTSAEVAQTLLQWEFAA